MSQFWEGRGRPRRSHPAKPQVLPVLLPPDLGADPEGRDSAEAAQEELVQRPAAAPSLVSEAQERAVPRNYRKHTIYINVHTTPGSWILGCHPAPVPVVSVLVQTAGENSRETSAGDP